MLCSSVRRRSALIFGVIAFFVLLAQQAVPAVQAQTATPSGILVPVIYASIPGADSRIVAFPEGAIGDVIPLLAISTSAPPIDIDLDAVGNLYATHFATNSVTVYAPGASGTPTPIRTIAGAATQLHRPRGIDVDFGGNINVSGRVEDAFPAAGSVVRFAPGANGNIAPINVIDGRATGTGAPLCPSLGTCFIVPDPPKAAVSPSGDTVVTNFTQALNSVVYGPGATGEAVPVQIIDGDLGADGAPNGFPPGEDRRAPLGLAFDSGGTLYMTEKPPGEISIFTKDSSGKYVRTRHIRGPELTAGSVRHIALDEVRRKILVADFFAASGFRGSVSEYSMDASGDNILPNAVIAGPNTQLGTNTQGIAVTQCQVTGQPGGAQTIKAPSICALDDAQLAGALRVEPGATVMVRNSTMGSIDARGARAIRVCGSTINGSVRATGAQSVVLGDGPLCASNTIRGPVAR